jgi:ATP-dependent helicase/nuclease subunit A
LETVSDRARRKAAEGDRAAAEVALVELGQDVSHPAGARFGALVHAVLAAIPLDAGADRIDEMTGLQARVLAALPEEAAAASALVAAALATPLMMRARAAWKAGRCRREAPIAWVEADGALVEGVLDLAFEDDGAWTIIDFKTKVETERDLARYRRQVGLYAAAVAKATGRDARGYLIQL